MFSQTPKCWTRIHQSNPSKLKFKQKWRKRFEFLKGGFESHFQRVQTEEDDSNSSNEDSNPDSRKCKLKSLMATIRIPISVRAAQTNGFESPSKRFESQVKKKSETEGHKFKSLNKGFESLMKNIWRDWSWIQITYTTIRIPEFWVIKNKSKRFESLIQNEAEGWKPDWRIQIFELWIWIPHWRKIWILQRWFESSTHRFESLFPPKH